MNQTVPSLTILAPDGSEEMILLKQSSYKIGRIPEANDIVLMDLDGVITRTSHCLLKNIDGSWWIEDQSTNGTILARNKGQVQLQDLQYPQMELFSGDRIIIHNWELIFKNPSQSLYNTTKNLKGLVFKCKYQTPFVFNVTELKLYQIQDGQKYLLQGIRPKVRDMLAYMAKKNLENGNQATLCNYEELIRGVWQKNEGDNITRDDVYTLGKEIRQILKEASEKASIDNQSEQWLETVKRLGLRLNIDIETVETALRK